MNNNDVIEIGIEVIEFEYDPNDYKFSNRFLVCPKVNDIIVSLPDEKGKVKIFTVKSVWHEPDKYGINRPKIYVRKADE